MWGISIHSLRMEGDGAITTPGYVGDISIHSLRMEGDSRHCACGRSQLHFNPLPPHGGRLPFSNRRFTDSTFQSTPSAWRETHWHNGQSITRQFQSTPSAWRETSQVLGVDLSGDYFNPLPPHGGRLGHTAHQASCPVISIHSLRMEGDLVLPPGHKQRELISIHSLRMEGDLYPYGYSDASDISIHSLRMEGDTAYPDQTNQGYNFNPLPPHGGRLSYVSDIPSCVTISIHSLRMEGDTSSGYAFPGKYISIHSLRMEGDHCMSRIVPG